MTKKRRDPRLNQAIGQRIRAMRRALGLSQGAVAKPLGLTFQEVQKYEKGIDAIPIHRLAALAKVLQTNIGEILDLGKADGRNPIVGITEGILGAEGGPRVLAAVHNLAMRRPDLLPSLANVADAIASTTKGN